MHITYYTQHQQRPLAPDDVREILKQDDGVVWIDLTIADETHMAFLETAFSFHPLAMEDLYHQQQRPKAEEFADYLFIILNPIETTLSEAMFRELGVFVGKNYVITAHMTDEPVITEARKRLHPERMNLPLSATYVLYVIFDTVLDGYLPALEAIEEKMEAVGRDTLRNPSRDILNRIFELKRIMNQFWWVMWPQQDIINVLNNHELVFIDQKSRYYLRDISDHSARIMNSLQIERDTITSLTNIYISAISNQLNYAVGRLTLLAIGVGIIAVFSGFYGMNFERTWPPFNAPWGVAAVLLMMAGTILVTFIFLRWKKWI